MKRPFDTMVAAVLLVVLFIPMLFIGLAVKLSSRGPALFWSRRVGLDNRIFMMPKFRTMYSNTPDVATHLLEDPETYLTPIGSVLRRYSLDELPQIWSILKGDMSLVGPRPALHNQEDLVEFRTAKGIHMLTPGITGWAQVNGRDSISIPVKVRYDEYYLNHRTFLFDMKILWMTFLKVIRSEGIKH
ncbi:MAG: Undecaprenyl phosphate N,N'-diacetylbacillosamine 1-phosphate transferase [Syntrophorhabdus sp. PtaB.Bin047]|nr:MAG: Undecaprenyl phosphate N,N'-diacetylbacillosamine 1-phosphate transferase [Syntrophorhabdus sp. PtaB.Bin047]